MGKNFVEFDEKKVNNIPDYEIVSIIKNGNYEPMSIIITRYYPVILKYVNKYCPPDLREDAVQEAICALYSAVKAFDGQKASFSTFAGICIKRSVIAFLRSRNRQKEIPSELVTPIHELEIPDNNSCPEKIFFDKNDYKSLADTIRLELSPLEYKVLQLYIRGYRYSVIANKLNLNEKSVSNALIRIRNKLKRK